jgi:Holliday junction resolvase RusA-like endonuclease
MEALQWAWKLAGAVKLEGPLACRAIFYLSRPASHFGTGRNAGQLKASAPRFPTGKPDVDNLLKIIDALTGLAYHDDAQVVQVMDLAKRYADDELGPRTFLELWPWRPPLA